LGWRNPKGLVLRRVDYEEANELTTELHSGLCGEHFAPKTNNHKILRATYYWPNIFIDVHAFVKSCQPCQLVEGKHKLDALPLHPVVVEAHLQQLGFNFNREFHRKSSNGLKWIIAVTN
jgi:hypothetical protein